MEQEIKTADNKLWKYNEKKFVEIEQETPEDVFKRILSSVTKIQFSKKYPKSTFYKIGDQILFELENDIVWVSEMLMWQVLVRRFSMDYNTVQSFIKKRLEQHLKITASTPESNSR